MDIERLHENSGRESSLQKEWEQAADKKQRQQQQIEKINVPGLEQAVGPAKERATYQQDDSAAQDGPKHLKSQL